MEKNPNIEKTSKRYVPISISCCLVDLRLILYLLALLSFCLVPLLPQNAAAACGATTRTWDSGGGDDDWDTAQNWSQNTEPSGSTDNATIIAGARDTQVNQNVTVSCMDVVSGWVTDRNSRRLTIVGDYFRALTANTVTFDSGSFWLEMAGTAPQTLEMVDRIRNVEISNDTTVTFTRPFEIYRQLLFSASWVGTLFIEEDLFLNTGTALTIPSGATVIIRNGATVTTFGNWTINGTLRIESGSSLRPGDNEVITVGVGGILVMAGSSGNPAVLGGQDLSDDITINIAGTFNGDYFQIARTGNAGMNVTGTIQKMDHGEFHYPDNTGYSITLGSSVSLPPNMDTVGFFNDNNEASVQNIDASNYNGSATTINTWSGSNGGAGNEDDGNGKINWGSQAGTELALIDTSDVNFTINQNATATVASFSFALNQSGTATDITQVVVSQVSTATSTDIEWIDVYRDAASSRNCAFNNGTDLSITGQVQLSGTPPSYTVNIPAGDVATSGDTDGYCIHIRAKTTTTAQDEKYIQFAIQNTADVTNSQGYNFSVSSSPPVTVSPAIRINGDAVRRWEGSTSTSWNNSNNWTGGIPTTTRDCQVGVGQVAAEVNLAQAVCQNADLLTGGTMDWNDSSNEFAVYAGLNVSSGYTFDRATVGPGVIAMRGPSSQGLSLETEFPGDLEILNTGGAGDETISINADSIVGGDVIITTGVIRIASPNTLTVRGDLTCQSGAGLEVMAGATLAMGNNSTLTIDSGCSFVIVGDSSQNAVVTSDSGASSYIVVVNGTIEARYYTFDHLGINGVSIEAGATINASNHLQDGAFTYPVNNNSTMLKLKQKVPTDTMHDMTFSLNGSSATGTTNIDSTGAAAGTLSLNNYTGDISGLSFDTDPSYLLSWLGATNTISITQEATNGASLNAGATYNMGRFGFQQTLAGASYVDTDITSLKLTLTGTASASDVTEVKIYFDSNCDSSGGSLIGSGSLSGSPPSRTFGISAGSAVIEADVSSPPLRCVYVEYVMAGGAIDGNTAGVKISSGTDIVNSQTYSINSSTLPPIDLGTAASIVGANITYWTGTTSPDWFVAGNWSAGLPDATKICNIDSAGNAPNINGGSGTAICSSINIGNGVLTFQTGTTAVLEVYGNFDNTGTLIQNDGSILMRDDGVTATNQGLNSSTAIVALSFNKTVGGTVYVNSSSLTINSLIFPASSNFDFQIPSGKILILPNSTSVVDVTFDIEGGGILKMGDATSLTVNSGAKLKMVGSSGSLAQITSDAGPNDYQVIINGEIQARYFSFDHLGLNGVSIESGATINTTDDLQDGEFTYPVPNNSTLLKLKLKVPTDTINSIKFDLAGSSATGTKNIDTTGAAAGTLTITSYTGDLGGPVNDTDPSYTINWNGAINSIDLTQEATSPASVTAGNTYNMGRFGFQQTLAGGSYSDADITSLKLSLTGTAAVTDLDLVRIYYDSDCDSAAGILIGSGTFSGSPLSRTFSLSAGDATIPSDVSSTVKRCIYVEYDIAGGAVNLNTLGVEIAANSHLSNDQGYSIADGTPAPVNLGTSSSIVGATVTVWNGSTSNAWATAGNWSAGVPSSTINCTIPDVTTDPIISTGTVACKQVIISSGGSLTLNGASDSLEAHANYSNSGSMTYNGGSLVMAGGSGNNTIASAAVISNLGFNKTGGTVTIVSSIVQITNIDFATNDSTVNLDVASSKTLKIGSSFTLGSGSNVKTLTVSPGGTVEMDDATTLTVNANGVLKVVGTNSNDSTFTSTAASNSYNIIVNTGTIEARYYIFDHLNTAGVSIEAGASINASNHLQNGQFTYPVNNSTTLLSLKTQVPTNSMDAVSFDLAGSAATGSLNINTTGATAGTLTINAYTGDLAGPSNDVDPLYNVSWTGAVNTIDITQEATGPASLNAGSTINMGRFGFKQTLAGASYSNIDITSLKLTLTGTATASDISQVRIYYDSDCNSIAGTLIGSGTLAGSPLTKTFSLSANDATVETDTSSPPLRCIYIEVDIAAGAIDHNTAGFKINATADFVNDQAYAVASGTPLPVNLGSTSSIIGAINTNWTGTTDTDWFTATNWSSGVPDASKTCQISNVTNDPVINGGAGVAICKNVTISNGIVTLVNATSAILEIHGNYNNTGTLTQNDGTLRFEDAGAGSDQTFSSTTTTSSLTFDKTTGGSIRVNTTTTINSLTFPGGSTFEFKVPSSITLTLPNGFSLPSGTFNIESGGTVAIGNGQTVIINGGTFKTTGINDTADQSLTNKGIMTISGAGEWAFTATSGTVDLTGFLFKYMDSNGLNIGGSTNLANLDGGQFTNLNADYITPVKAIQLNTTGSVPATATNIGWMWDGPNFSKSTSCCAPNTTDTYYIVYAPNCGSATITFDQWFGDFAVNANTPNTEDKIFDTDDGQACQISVAASASPVSLLGLSATPYDGAISLDWETSTEVDHAGFHVYRSPYPSFGYVQVNSELIRNILTSSTFHGVYRYVDTNLNNDTTYYYKIEDVSYFGFTELHGPVSAQAKAGLGSPPPDPTDANSSGSAPGAETGNGSVPGPILNNDLVDLGNGVHVLAKTAHSLRIEIIPPAETWNTSLWDGSYYTLAVPGYSSTIRPGWPELVERTILIEVGDDHSQVVATSETISLQVPVNYQLAPAPSWALDSNGVLQTSYSPDATAYAISGLEPASYYTLDPAIKKIGNKSYIEIKVNPFAYDAVAQQARGVSRIILDLSLDGQPAWSAAPPDLSLNQSPAAVAGTLRIAYSQKGFFQLSFADIRAAGLDGPFGGIDINELRLYYHGQEVAMTIDSPSGYFATGDSIRFYGNFNPGLEDTHDEVVLGSSDLLLSGTAALRMLDIDGDPTGSTLNSEEGTQGLATYEWNWGPVFTIPMGDFVDRYFMPLIYATRTDPNPAPSYTYIDLPVPLPGLIQSASQNLTLSISLVARASFATNAIHHVGLFINNIPYMVAEKSFQGRGLHTVIFQLPHSYFFDGTNTIRVQALGDLLPEGDAEIINLDKVEISYRSFRAAVNGVATVENRQPDTALTMTGFLSANLVVYDISNSLQPLVLNNVATLLAASGEYEASFTANWAVIDDEVVNGSKFVGVQDAGYLQVSSLALGKGSTMSLKSSLGADLIIIGGSELLDAATDLIALRKSEGLRVVTAPLEQVYSEFSNGLTSSQAIKDFVNFAYANWTAPAPKYLLLLGDATFDPRDHSSFGLSKNTMPVPIEKGLYLDFGNDNWYVTPDGSNVPFMSVGRIPSSKYEDVYNYIQKLLKYENGSMSPTGSNALNSVFISDTSTENEGFANENQKLANSLTAVRPEFNVVTIDRAIASSDGSANAEIIDEFNKGPLLVTYLGHGGEHIWASNAFFSETHAANLSNSKLPIVSGLNCLNTLFYEADPDASSLGEKFVFNPDGGAIAYLGFTTMTIPPVQLALATAFGNEISSATLQSYHTVRIGDLGLRAKVALGDTESTKDTLRSWTLFGDPSMKLPQTVFSTSVAVAPGQSPSDEPVPEAPTPAPVASNNDSDGGFFGCGKVTNLPPPPTNMTLLLVLLLMGLPLLAQGLTKQRG